MNSPATEGPGLRQVPPRAVGLTHLQPGAAGLTHPQIRTRKSSTKGGWLDSPAKQEVKVSITYKKIKKYISSVKKKLRNLDNYSTKLTVVRQFSLVRFGEKTQP